MKIMEQIIDLPSIYHILLKQSIQNPSKIPDLSIFAGELPDFCASATPCTTASRSTTPSASLPESGARSTGNGRSAWCVDLTAGSWRENMEILP